MKITHNFNLSEFASKDGSTIPSDLLPNIQSLAKNLEVLRGYFGKPIHINSGYRSPEHNKKIGGAAKSQHLLGNAADIYINGILPIEIYKVIEKLIDEGNMIEGGLGLYKTFVHYDIRGVKSRWNFSV